jgi:hypothetical protein
MGVTLLATRLLHTLVFGPAGLAKFADQVVSSTGDVR